MMAWFRKEPAAPSPSSQSSAEHPLRDGLFGDRPLDVWAQDGARAGVGEPWVRFAEAVERSGQGDAAGAQRALEAVLRQPDLESRHYLEAWHALRELGAAPPPSDAKHVYGVVVDVPMPPGLDTLAAYEDRSARFLSHGGGAIVWEHPDVSLDAQVDALLAAGRALAGRIGPWAGARPPLPPGAARISVLTPSGLHFGQGPMGAFLRDAMAALVIAAATALMQALVTRDG